MENGKIAATPEGAQALREFAHSMPVAVANIVSAGETLSATYARLADELGIHESDFRRLIHRIKKIQDDATNMIGELPQKLESVANAIEINYVQNHPTI